MTQDQALTVADDAIVSALSAVGEIMPASVRDRLGRQLVLASPPRKDRSAGPRRHAGQGANRSCRIMKVCSFDHDAPTLEDILEG